MAREGLLCIYCVFVSINDDACFMMMRIAARGAASDEREGGIRAHFVKEASI
jgi:hypothetical protein